MSVASRKEVSAEKQKMLIDAATNSKTKQMKRLLPTVLTCEIRNGEGKTLLHIACQNADVNMAELLLNYQANPNARSLFDDSTPVLAAATTCNMDLLQLLIKRGGDVRLHDIRGRGIRDYVKLNKNKFSRNKALSFLDSKRRMVKAIVGAKSQHSEEQTSQSEDDGRPDNSADNLRLSRCSVTNLGYGNIFYEDSVMKGLIGIIPIGLESELSDDLSSEPKVFANGKFMEMKRQRWCQIPVSVKVVSDEEGETSIKDLLINESRFMSLVRHPSILLLMAVCVTDSMNSIRLVYERVQSISLNGLLHNPQYKIEITEGKRNCIMRQVASALFYLHHRGLLHRLITSHAIFLVKNDLAKLGNFEYMIERDSAGKVAKRSEVLKNRYLNAGYNWMARELILGNAPSEKTDIYSLCVVLWEMVHEKCPFSDVTFEQFKSMMKRRSPLNISRPVSAPIKEILLCGLSGIASDRPSLWTIMAKLEEEWKILERKKAADS